MVKEKIDYTKWILLVVVCAFLFMAGLVFGFAMGGGMERVDYLNSNPLENNWKESQACVSGCIGGMQYNGTGFERMELSEQDVSKIQECQRFCKLYLESDMSKKNVLPGD